MISRLFHILLFPAILGSSWGQLAFESPDGTARQGAEAPLTVQPRAFTQESANRDMVSVNMFKVYERYNKEPRSQREGNTVRSFKAVPSEYIYLFISSSYKVTGLKTTASLFLPKRSSNCWYYWLIIFIRCFLKQLYLKNQKRLCLGVLMIEQIFSLITHNQHKIDRNQFLFLMKSNKCKPKLLKKFTLFPK